MLFLLACAPQSPDPVDTGGRCTDDGERVTCAHHTTLVTGREVHWQVPTGDAPDAGWPAVLLFQGSTQTAALAWEADDGTPFGGLHQARLVTALLEQGFAVLTPEAAWDGLTWWQTNTWPCSFAWEGCADDLLMEGILAGITDGTFGALDRSRLYATGISSGGYMTSRMALSYPGEFRALAIQSASWATCAGVLCSLPGTLPADHPPTLFLHGDADLVVPIGTMRRYATRLEQDGVEVRRIEDPGEGHAWSASAPAEVPEWFIDHP